MNASVARAWIDGTPATDALLRDRGLHYGDGLFETVTVRAGRTRFAALHAARLAEGCRRLGIACDAYATLATALDGLDLGEGGTVALHGTVKLVVTRGDAVARGYGTTGTEQARVLRYWYPGAAPARPTQWTAVTLAQRWGENPALAGMKHLNRLEQVLARRELAALGADEGVVASESGALVSGTTCNLFVQLQGRLLTPRVDRCGIAGVMRAALLREAAARGIEVVEARIAADDLARVTALCFSNARIGLLPATRLDGRLLEQPAEFEQLRGALDAIDE